MYTRTQRNAFLRDGYIVLRRLVDAESQFSLCAVVNSLLNTERAQEHDDVVPPSIAKPIRDDEGRILLVPRLRHPDLVTFFSSTDFIALAGELLGEPATPSLPEWLDRPPGSQGITPAHQDNAYFGFEIPSFLTLWIAMDRIATDNGAVGFEVGSHLIGEIEHQSCDVPGFSRSLGDYSSAHFVRPKLEPGDALAFHGLVIHDAGFNRSTRHRRALAAVYKGESCLSGGRDEAYRDWAT